MQLRCPVATDSVPSGLYKAVNPGTVLSYSWLTIAHKELSLKVTWIDVWLELLTQCTVMGSWKIIIVRFGQDREYN